MVSRLVFPRRPLLRRTPVQHALRRAKNRDLVPALLLLSYPLHPPRKPEQQRTQHLPDLRTPTLFVHGTRDPFGSIAEIERALKMIPAKTKLLPVEGAGHDLGFKGKRSRKTLPRLIFSEFTKLCRRDVVIADVSAKRPECISNVLLRERSMDPFAQRPRTPDDRPDS